MTPTIRPLNSALVFAVSVYLILGCSRPRIEPPVTSVAIYDLPATLTYANEWRRFSLYLEGTKGFKMKGSSGCQIEQFLFDSPEDFMEVQIRDEAGVPPSRQFDYTLEHKNNGTRRDFWNILIRNPASSGVLMSNFLYKFTLKPVANGDLEWRRAKDSIGGDYELGTTDRRMTVTIRFHLEAQVSGQIESVCQDEK